MPGDLSVDDAGLTDAAGRSDDIAAALAAGSDQGCSAGSQSSHAGVAALYYAIRAARIRQSSRTATQVGAMRTSAALYRHTDDDAAGAMTRPL